LVLPNNSIIHTLYLNPVSKLEIRNATDLKNIVLDTKEYEPWGNKDKITNGIYDTLSDVTIINCPAMNEYSY
jgi:hypothetical protein